MAGTSQFMIGTEVSCGDGAVGKVSRVIIDPGAEEVSHLVVAAEHRQDLGRLVPLGLVDSLAGEIRLRCTKAELCTPLTATSAGSRASSSTRAAAT